MEKQKFTKKYKSITKEHIKDIKDVDRGVSSGVIYKLKNKEAIEEPLKKTAEVVIPKIKVDFPEFNIDITDVNIYHKPKSRYKYIDITIGLIS